MESMESMVSGCGLRRAKAVTHHPMIFAAPDAAGFADVGTDETKGEIFKFGPF